MFINVKVNVIRIRDIHFHRKLFRETIKSKCLSLTNVFIVLLIEVLVSFLSSRFSDMDILLISNSNVRA